jgi:DNA-binding winged helix-turn-helix (wHTH) protein
MRPAATAYRFGPYELRVHSRELRKDGRRLKVRPQPFQVLRLLIERAPAVVTREELRESLWSPDTFVDFEHGLNTSIKELRGILGDSATEPTYIETVPKLGYRMVAAVEVEPAAAPVGPFDGSPGATGSIDDALECGGAAAAFVLEVMVRAVVRRSGGVGVDDRRRVGSIGTLAQSDARSGQTRRRTDRHGGAAV